VEFGPHGEAVGLVKMSTRLILARDESDVESLGGNFVTNEVKVDFNMFGSSMKGRVGGEVCGANVVTP
jgi:hypothetical protein